MLEWLRSPEFLAVLVLLVAATRLALWFLRAQKPLPTYRELDLQFIDVDDFWIRFHRSGKGPYLLLVHGIGANLYCWRYLIPILARQFTVVAMDLPGFGQSTKLPAADYGLDEQTKRLFRFMDRLNIKAAFVVGNSMGGNLALWMTKVAPERVLGCSAIAPAVSPRLVPVALAKLTWLAKPASLLLTRTALKWAHARTVSRKERLSPERIEESFSIYGRQHEAAQTFMRASQAIRDQRLPTSLASIQQRVQILWGTEDKLVPRRVIDAAKATLPKCECHIHEGGGHHLQEDEPEWVSEKLTDFFLR